VASGRKQSLCGSRTGAFANRVVFKDGIYVR
jgi:hypothetical protein